MIDVDYENFMSDKYFYKQISKLQPTKGNSPTSKYTTIKKTFYGNKNFPLDFVSSPEVYQSFEIEVKEYAREYTQHLRVIHKYTRTDFFESLRPITNEEKLKALFDQTSGRGGYPLFSTANKKFIIKQISKYEKMTLLKTFLIPYHQHVIKNSSFICRVLGLFAIRVNGKFKIYSLIMQNIDPLPSELVDFKYDMKMSTVNRQQLKDEEVETARKYFLGMNSDYAEILDNKHSPLRPEKARGTRRYHMNEKIKEGLQKLKDIDFAKLHNTLPIGIAQASIWEAAQAKIRKDVRFLESINIMDYSLIITVAKIRYGSIRAPSRIGEGLYEKEKLPEEFTTLQQNGNCLFSPSGKFAYIFGLIDILQEYDIEKKGEGGLKGVIAIFSGKPDISCQPPNTYADRFLKKLGGVFTVEGEKKMEEELLELSIENLGIIKKKHE